MGIPDSLPDTGTQAEPDRHVGAASSDRVRGALIVDDLDQVHRVDQNQQGRHRDDDQQEALPPRAKAMTDASTCDGKDHPDDEQDLAS